MLPLGNTPFGLGYLGRGDWGARTFWENVPADHRMQDTDGYLEGLLWTWAREYDQLKEMIRFLPEVRDPWLARATEGGEWMYVTDCVIETDATYGEVVKLIEERDPAAWPTGTTGAAWLPYTAIDEVGGTWRVLVGDGEWPVVNVRTRNADDVAHYDPATSFGNEVWCSTGTLLPFAHTADLVGRGDGTATPLIALPIDSWLTVSSITFAFTGSVSGALTGVDDGLGGLWVGAVQVGTVAYQTGALAFDTTLLGEVAVDGTDILFSYAVEGYFLRARRMPLLERLYGDFGILADRDVPEWVQRAALIHYQWYMGQKGCTPAYEILGSIYLFTVTAMGLWEVCDFAQIADYDPAHIFTMGVGPGIRYFTDVDPRRLRFDDIAADAEYYDWVGDHNSGVPGLVPLTDQSLMFDDGSVLPAGDGWSVAKGFAVDVTQGYYYPARMPCTVDSATALTPADLALYGLSFGWRVVVNMSVAQRAEFNFTGRGIFALSEYDAAGLVPPTFAADAWFIDADEGYGAGQWTVIIGALTPPTVGADVAVRYWPQVDTTDCCYCRTSYVRFRVLPSAAALAYYGVDDTATARLIRARDRLEARIQRLLVPQHVRIFEFAHS